MLSATEWSSCPTSHAASELIQSPMEDSPELKDQSLQSDSPRIISWPVNRPTTRVSPSPSNFDSAPAASELKSPSYFLAATVHPSNLPSQPKSLSSISLRAFLLGLTFGVCCLATLLLAFGASVHGTSTVESRSIRSLYPLWRAPFLLAVLSIFHFLEYYTTATYNPRYANVSAFLLSQNGRAYNAAHTAALVEVIFCAVLLPGWQATMSNPTTVTLGCILIALGQWVRTSAMVQAGTNFNHTVQTKRDEGHVLVRDGIYRWLRHPSYFGFFWWGLGTQIVLGNVVCLLAYAAILWAFFSIRIKSESYHARGYAGRSLRTKKHC